MESKLLEGLNPAQKEAVEFKDGPLLVLAGPGSGKTRVVTHRIARLIEKGVPGWQIAALTFTNKAAEEMKGRLEILAPGNRVWIGTFHRFCAWLLRNYIDYTGLSPNFTIYDTDESKQLIEGLIDKRDLPNGCDAGKILAAISWAKNGLVLPEDYQAREGHLLGKTVEKVYPEYQKALRRANAVDFDDLLIHVALLLKNNEEIRQQLDYRFRYILVDEYQDTNLVQYAIARSLSIDYPNLAVTGDPDQSIYGWRGANIRNILEFEKDFENVKVIRLEENYRSNGNILAVASGLIKHNKLRKEKELFTKNPDGRKPRILRCFNHQEEAEAIASEIASEIESGKRSPRDYAIFFRMNALSRNLEHALRRHQVPFQLVRGLEFFNRKEIKDILAYLQLIYNPNDTVSFLRVINLPVRGIGKVTVGRLQDYAQRRGIPLLNAAKNVKEIPGISLKTRNAVKRFTEMIDKLSGMADDSDLELLLSVLLEETKYLTPLLHSEDEDDKQRLANVQELLSEMREFDKRFDEEENQAQLDVSDDPVQRDLFTPSFRDGGRLGRFLEQTALVSDVDAYDDSDRVSLMTLHAAKGLEFPVVYIIALEDNIIPHERSSYDKTQLEEERRLLFVGITRAKEELRMSRTEFREYRGNYSSSILSRFIFEFPPERIDLADSRLKTPESEGSQLPTDEEDYNQEAAAPWFRSDKGAFSPSSRGMTAPKGGETFLSDYLDQIPDEEEFSDRSEEDDPDLPPSGGRSIPSAGGRKKGGRGRKSRVLRTDESGITLEADEYCEQPADEDQELTFDEDGNLIPPQIARRRAKRTSGQAKKGRPALPGSFLQTAADLSSSPPVDSGGSVPPHSSGPSAVKPGVFVRHPAHGVGIVKEVFGPSIDRIALVEFLTGSGTTEIPLSDPDLKTIQKRK